MSLNTILATTPLTSTNYILKATGTTIGNSLIWDNGTNVGIGNTNTSFVLDVTGTIRATGSIYGDVGFRTKSLNGYLLKNDADSASLGGLVRRSLWAGGAALDTQIFAETGYGIYLNVNGSVTSGITITSAGNVGIGTSTPSEKLHLYNNTAATITSLIIENNVNNYNSQINFKSIYGGSTAKSFLIGSNISVAAGSWEIYDATASAARMVIASDGTIQQYAGTNQATGGAYNTFGNLYVASTTAQGTDIGGSISIGGKYNNAGAYATFARIQGKKENGSTGQTGGYLAFEVCTDATNLNTERMRITSGGNVIIQNNKIYGTGEYLGAIWNSNGGNTTWTIGDTPANQTSWNLRVNTSAAKSGGGSWGDSSDGRLKKDVQTIQNALDKINKLNPVTFEWINPEEHNNQYNIGGFIAQEIKEIFPQFVNEINAEGKDKDIVGENEVVYGLTLPFKFDAYIVKAIQEQQIQIQNLQEQINILAK